MDAHRRHEIAQLAYKLWERRGRPVGSPEIDWRAAERALGAQDSQEHFPLSGVHLEPEEGPYGEK